MRTAATLGAFGLVGIVGSVGCASTGARIQGSERSWSDLAERREASLRAGEARVLATRVDPLAPVDITSNDGEVAVRFSRPGRAQSMAHVGAGSLGLSASETDAEAKAPSTGVTRIVLDNRCFVLVWRRGGLESGYRALAQEFRADGSPMGMPVVLSPPDVDVMGTPRAVTTDGHRVVVTFAAESERGSELVAVPVDPVQPLSDGGEPLARR